MLTLKQAENVFRSGTPPVDGDRTFEGFLYGYEPKLNEIVRKFLGKHAFDPETFMDYKLACADAMFERWNDFDPGKGIQFATFAHHDVMNSLLRSRMLEEAGSFSNLDEYKAARRMGALMYGTEQREAVDEFIKKRGCSKATAIRFLKIAQLMLSTSPLENASEASYSWDYVDVLWDGVRAEKVREAFAKLSFREQTLLEKRSAICMTCGRVSPLSERASFEDLAIEFESSSPRTAERAYRRAVERLTLNLVELGELHVVRIERVAPGTYRYQADSDGYWGEFTLDPATGEQKISSLAELDTTKTHRFAKQAARYLKAHAGEKLPKTVLLTFE
jgi:hypothetical protein